MNIRDSVKNNVEYGRKLVASGWEGAQEGGKEGLNGESLPSVLAESAKDSWALIAIGAGVGVLASYLANKRKLTPQTALFGLLGGALGFSVGMTWGTRHVTGAAARGAMRHINAARDEHWLENNPIDYA